jgi:uncharacterized protein YxjI
MKTTFFDLNNYIVDENIDHFKFQNSYKIRNNQGEEIGCVLQKNSALQKILRLLINKNFLPFNMEITDSSGNLQASISRGWNLFMSTISIRNAAGINIGTIKQKFRFLRPTFKIYNKSENIVAEIFGDWTAWKFEINNAKGQKIGTINKKWNGAMKEMFTTADKYNVELDLIDFELFDRIAILSAAITVDMVLKESK